jgi:hypothetical protein
VAQSPSVVYGCTTPHDVLEALTDDGRAAPWRFNAHASPRSEGAPGEAELEDFLGLVDRPLAGRRGTTDLAGRNS